MIQKLLVFFREYRLFYLLRAGDMRLSLDVINILHRHGFGGKKRGIDSIGNEEMRKQLEKKIEDEVFLANAIRKSKDGNVDLIETIIKFAE